MENIALSKRSAQQSGASYLYVRNIGSGFVHFVLHKEKAKQEIPLCFKNL